MREAVAAFEDGGISINRYDGAWGLTAKALERAVQAERSARLRVRSR
jgi:hypothetical protein